MMAFILNLGFSAIVLANPNCELKSHSPDKATLLIDQQRIELSVLSSSSKLISCETKKEFPNLIFAKVFMGEAGTQKISRPVNLFIIRKTSKDLKQIFSYELGDQKDKKLADYKLKKTKKGVEIKIGEDPEVYFLKP